MDAILEPDEIERRCQATGISMNELLRRAGITRSTYWRWKAGKTSPSLLLYGKLIETLNTAEGAISSRRE